ncbi:hypothetical protein ABL78_4684 [Leptomonas seymouri]|uniref:Chromo domain-containing protein n=1 Tax=Leptomonas seymouri TaxID=5684 RepID=A0A0N1I624_LEPSE|nr:hypothetical protein ABL78_4684 [Leptomonas seymouri]|eukprot:KPI86258.1 hypothetical protein ABL78_4684 [Leptomonas seymouri]
MALRKQDRCVATMAHRCMAAVTGRRINDDDGSIEYAVQWEGYGDEVTWEQRHHLTEHCAEMVQAVDQQCMDTTDAVLTQWRYAQWEECGIETSGSPPPLRSTSGCKRSRSPSQAGSASHGGLTAAKLGSSEGEADKDVEVLNGLLLRATHGAGGKSEGGEGDAHVHKEEATLLMLGEVVLADEASATLNRGSGSRRGRRPAAATSALSLCTAPALGVEKMWREAHGQSLLHSVEVSRHVTPFRDNYQLHLHNAETQLLLAQEAARSSHLRILGIAPPHAAYSGAVFSAPVALEGLVGERDVEEMRLSVQLESPIYGNAAQEISKPHVEQMVVRYMIGDTSSSGTAATGGTPRRTEPCHASGHASSMPLSVFRLVFPQLLIDYLLENSVVLH